jgi:hypothetical protein
MLQDEDVRLVGPCAALVDARLVQYGTTAGTSGIRVVLVFKKQGGEWMIASWRMSEPQSFSGISAAVLFRRLWCHSSPPINIFTIFLQGPNILHANRPVEWVWSRESN